MRLRKFAEAGLRGPTARGLAVRQKMAHHPNPFLHIGDGGKDAFPEATLIEKLEQLLQWHTQAASQWEDIKKTQEEFHKRQQAQLESFDVRLKTVEEFIRKLSSEAEKRPMRVLTKEQNVRASLNLMTSILGDVALRRRAEVQTDSMRGVSGHTTQHGGAQGALEAPVRPI